MALPTTISGVAFPTTHFDFGPFIDGNGNVYVVALDSADNSIIEVWKATDPTSSFTEQDSANKPNSTQNIAAIWAVKHGTTIRIGTQQTTAGSRAVEYHEFNTSDAGSNPDTWVTVNEAVATVDNNSATYGAAICMRSDNDRIVLHNGPNELIDALRYERVVYSRWEGSTWTSNVAVSVTGVQRNHVGAGAVIGESDKAHLFHIDSDASDLMHRSLDSANSLGTEHTVYNALLGADLAGVTEPTYYDDGGTERIRIAFRNATGLVAVGRIDDDGTPATTTVSASTASSVNSRPTISLAQRSNGDLQASWADESTVDLYRDVAASPHTSWGTDTYILTSVTVNRLNSSVYVRGGDTVLAYVYLDGTTFKYNEYVLQIGDRSINVFDSVAVADVPTVSLEGGALLIYVIK